MTKAVVSIHVEAFRSLRNVTLVPGRTTVLIGANGSGKSNLLSVLKLIPLLRTGNLRRFVAESGGASALLHRGPRVSRELILRIDFSQETGENAYVARLGYAANDTLIFLEESVEFRRDARSPAKVYSLGAGQAESMLDTAGQVGAGKPTATTVRWWLSRMSFFHFHDTSVTSPLRQNSRQEDTRYLRSDGSNLGAYLYSLSKGESDAYVKSWNRINATVRRIAPFISELSPSLVVPDRPDTSPIRLDWIDDRGDVYGPHQLSDGTLRGIALVTALAQPTEKLPVFMSIDEPELGLHPAALGVLASLVQSVSAHCQVLLATQSPSLLDLFTPDDVVVVERKDGETSLERLSTERLADWLDDYSLSDLWAQNQLGGRP